jgi:O-antigen ligase
MENGLVHSTFTIPETSPSRKKAMTVTAVGALPRYADETARWAAIGLGLTIPISVALDNVLLVLVLGGWLAGGGYLSKLLLIKNNLLALSAVALVALLLAGTLYGDRYPGDGILYLGKYSDLLFIPVFLYLFRDSESRRRAILALAASLGVVLVLSFLLKTGIIPKNPLTIGEPAYPVVFKLRLTHNILMAFAAFLFAWLALTAEPSRFRWGWAMLALFAVINVTVMVQGATGYLILGGLILLVGFDRDGWRGLGIATAGIVALVVTLTIVPGPFQQRLDAITQEAQEWTASDPAQTSAGLRLEFYRNTLAIIADHPVLGVGTGGFPKAYADKVRGTGAVETRNPHNEFLHIMAQIGIAGLAALLCLFYLQWRLAARLALPLERRLARGLVLTIVTGCMLNSLLLDHTEGLLYAWLTGVLYGGLKSKRE